MSQKPPMHEPSNPFSTRFVRPGRSPIAFRPATTPTRSSTGWRPIGWRGQIVGPHGSGKSTLLAGLLEPLERAGRRPWLVTLVDRQRRLPADWLSQAEAAAATLLVIDGYEQLGWWSRRARRRDLSPAQAGDCWSQRTRTWAFQPSSARPATCKSQRRSLIACWRTAGLTTA